MMRLEACRYSAIPAGNGIMERPRSYFLSLPRKSDFSENPGTMERSVGGSNS